MARDAGGDDADTLTATPLCGEAGSVSGLLESRKFFYNP